jgi:hypothetical protein
LGNCAQNVTFTMQKAGSALVEYTGNEVQKVTSTGSNIAGYLSNWVPNLSNCAQNVASAVQKVDHH